MLGLPWWRSGWESACRCRGCGFVPQSGRIPHSTERLGPWAIAAGPACPKPVLRNGRGHNSERPAYCKKTSKQTKKTNICWMFPEPQAPCKALAIKAQSDTVPVLEPGSLLAHTVLLCVRKRCRLLKEKDIKLVNILFPFQWQIHYSKWIIKDKWILVIT